MELIAYVAMAAGAYVALVTRHRAVAYGWFILFAIFSLVAHLSPQVTGDMIRYYEFAQDWPPCLNTLTLREPVFYFLYPVVRALTGNGTVTFLIFDLLGGVIVMHAMKALDDDGSDYMLALAPTIISSYVFLLGQQNVLRQHLATIILLWSLAARARNQRRAFPLLVLSLLAHNMTAVTLGYWWDVGRTRRHQYGPLITVVGVILIALLLPAAGKSAHEGTGMRTEYLYLLVAGLLVLVLVFRDAPRLLGRRPFALLNFIAFAPAVAILSSTHFERIAMVFLVLILIELYGQYPSLQLGRSLAARLTHALRSQRRASQPARLACPLLSWLRRTFAAHLVYALLVIPALLFPSARSILL